MLKEGKLGQISFNEVTLDEFASVQARADRIYGVWGQSAPRPMHGEQLNDYRRRLLRPYQHHSAPFAKANLKVLAVDDAAFNHAEAEIWKVASDAVRDPSSVAYGVLRESTETKGGHTYVRFYGATSSWMDQFRPTYGRRRVKRIIERGDSGTRTLYERA